MDEPASITLSIERELKNAFLIGLSVNAICSYFELSREECYKVELVVMEALNNVIQHSEEPGGKRRVELTARLYSDRMVFEVSNWGTVDPSKGTLESSKGAPPAFDPGDIENLPEKGRGLYLIRSLMDEVKQNRSGEKSTLVLVKYIAKK